jgi:hypothetical protein
MLNVRALTNSSILDLWERAMQLHPLDRNLLVLSAALPESTKVLADWPLGRLNGALAQLFSACFGGRLEGWAACPECGEKLEFQMNSSELVSDTPAEPVSVNGRMFRLPSSRDLARSLAHPDANHAAMRLLESCQVEGDTPGEQDLEAAGEKMSRADPLAEIRLALACPACGHVWHETLDLGAFIWSKIETSAKRLLREVHALGSAYGWSEKEILSLSLARRSFYLEMVEA